MEKGDKTAEQDNGQAIIHEVETPQNTQPEAPPFEIDTQPPEVTTEEAEASPQQEPPEDTRQEWEKSLAEIEAEQQPKCRGRQRGRSALGKVCFLSSTFPRKDRVGG